MKASALIVISDFKISFHLLSIFYFSSLLNDFNWNFLVENYNIFLNSWGPIAVSLLFALSLLSTLLVWQCENSKLAMVFAEASAIIQLLLPILLPWKAVKHK